MPRDSKGRFTDRVEAYQRYRPSYPPEVLDLLDSECGLDTPQTLADIGSGTGILTRLLLERGHSVFGVEPNHAMRTAAEGRLSRWANFTSVDGTAEQTSLGDGSVHLIASGQAFHWFDLARTRREFCRILQPGGWLAILWNDRRKTSTPFLAAYEDLMLQHGSDYELVDHTRVSDTDLSTFFGPRGFDTVSFDNCQILDFAGLQGRLESSSYVPRSGTPGHAPMIDELETLFEIHSTDGTVRIDYDTVVFYGHLT